MKPFLKFLLTAFLILMCISLIGSVYRLFQGSDEYEHADANIAVIEIDGVITDSMPTLQQIRDLQDRASYKAVVVRVNSPGGAVGASQEIFMELKKLKAKLPVVVSMGDLAASGGLYVSLGSNVIVALPGTLTGSMGVLLELMNFRRLLEKVHVDPLTLKSGVLKDAGNPTAAMDPKTRDFLQSLIAKTFQSFKEDVVRERELKEDAAELLSDGRVIDGKEALKLGLVDELGTFEDAVRVAGVLGKVDGKVKLAFVSRKPKSWAHRLFEEASAPVINWLESKVDSPALQYRWEPLR
jgi:protease-4